jgi:putative effector of murein hydrolase
LAWIISLILLIFYFLGLFVFHGTKAIHLLPFLAVIVLLVDYLLAKRSRG